MRDSQALNHVTRIEVT